MQPLVAVAGQLLAAVVAAAAVRHLLRALEPLPHTRLQFGQLDAIFVQMCSVTLHRAIDSQILPMGLRPVAAMRQTCLVDSEVALSELRTLPLKTREFAAAVCRAS